MKKARERKKGKKDNIKRQRGWIVKRAIVGDRDKREQKKEKQNGRKKRREKTEI